tara:strand:- start:116 stop:580 length:465 start_codon:yes stop_codon:yes gene_type:complete
MSKGISICPMERTDADFILEIRNDDMTRFYVHDQRAFTKSDFEQWYETNKPKWYIVKNDNLPFGYFRTSNSNEETHSIWIGMDIHPDFRGKGLAKSAYAEFIKILKSNGYKKLSLEVLSHNFVARKLYEDLGFVEAGRKSHQYTIESIKMEMFI